MVINIAGRIYLFRRNLFCEFWSSKGSRKNNLAELVLRLGSDLADPNEQNHNNSEYFEDFASEASTKDGPKLRC